MGRARPRVSLVYPAARPIQMRYTDPETGLEVHRSLPLSCRYPSVDGVSRVSTVDREPAFAAHGTNLGTRLERVPICHE